MFPFSNNNVVSKKINIIFNSYGTKYWVATCEYDIYIYLNQWYFSYYSLRLNNCFESGNTQKNDWIYCLKIVFFTTRKTHNAVQKPTGPSISSTYREMKKKNLYHTRSTVRPNRTHQVSCADHGYGNGDVYMFIYHRWSAIAVAVFSLRLRRYTYRGIAMSA